MPTWHWLASLLGILAILLIEPGYREPLFNYSVDVYIPEKQAVTEGMAIWDAYSNYCLPVVVLVPLATLALWLGRGAERRRAFYYVAVLTANVFVMNISKLWYHEPRPFWVSQGIETQSCSSEYGSPSGHSLLATAFTLAVWLDYNQAMSQQRRDHEGSLVALSSQTSSTDSNTCRTIMSLWHFRVVMLVFTLFFIATIGLSRVILGVHSLDQVLFGIQLGAWLALTMHFCFKGRIEANWDRIFDNRNGDTGTADNDDYTRG